MIFSRRRLLLAALTGASAVDCSDQDPMSQNSGIPPWHLWGNTETKVVTSGGVVNTPVTSGQLAKVSYKRPETWTFFFAAKILSGLGPGGAPIGPGSLSVSFNLTLGVGRSQVTIPGFNIFVFQWIALAPPVLGTLRWTDNVLAPVVDMTAATPFRPIVSKFPSQDIQLDTTSILNTPVLGEHVELETHAFFSPRTHVRPSWWLRLFHGGEN